jgi:hypothetical protein
MYIVGLKNLIKGILDSINFDLTWQMVPIIIWISQYQHSAVLYHNINITHSTYHNSNSKTLYRFK